MISAGISDKRFNIIVIILSLLGVILSVELTVIYYNVNFVHNAAPSFCVLNEVINCDAVEKSAFAVFMGIPNSVWGLIYFSIMLLIAGLGSFDNFFSKEFKNTKSYIFSLATVGVVVSIVLGLVSSLYIHKICLLCYATYVINFVIFVLGWLGNGFVSHYKVALADFGHAMSKENYILAGVFVVLVTIAGLYYVNESRIFLPDKKIDLNNISDFPRYTKNVISGNVLGSKKPKLIIREYTDFQCPFCSLSNSMMHNLVSEVPDVQVIHHDFPLGGPCNPKVNNTAHKYSCMAALYSRAAEKQGNMWGLNDMMFQNQEDLSEQKILLMAESLNLDIAKLKKDAHDPAAMIKLKNDIKNEITKGIQATPTYYVGNKKQVGVMPYSKFKQFVLDELKNQNK